MIAGAFFALGAGLSFLALADLAFLEVEGDFLAAGALWVLFGVHTAFTKAAEGIFKNSEAPVPMVWARAPDSTADFR